MAILDDKEKPDLDALVHFGVKGMRWGHHKAQPSGGGGGGGGPAPITRKQNRQLNKEHRAKKRSERDAEIDAARERYHSSARSNYKAAKAQYKIDKKTIGTAAAREKFNAVKQKNMDDFNVAQQAKSGKEAVIATLLIVGGITLSAVNAAARAA